MKTRIPGALLAIVLTSVAARAATDITPPGVPGVLQVQDNEIAFVMAHAYGTQNYICLPAAGAYAWTLFGPQATLFSDDGGQVITHFLSANPDEDGLPRPTWQHSKDSSAAWGGFAVPSSDPAFVAPNSIPWLLLRVVGRQYGPTGGDRLVRATSIQRVNTSGGVAPASGCTQLSDVGRKALVPYTADYVFYRIRE